MLSIYQACPRRAILFRDLKLEILEYYINIAIRYTAELIRPSKRKKQSKVILYHTHHNPPIAIEIDHH